MSGVFGEPLSQVAAKEGVTLDVETLYEVSKIAMLTGWTVEYIESLGILYRESLLQIHDAEIKLTNMKRRK